MGDNSKNNFGVDQPDEVGYASITNTSGKKLNRRKFVQSSIAGLVALSGLASSQISFAAASASNSTTSTTSRKRPKAIAFDVIETLFDLRALRPAFVEAGLPGYSLELFFSQMLRDGFALESSHELLPFGELAVNTLKVTSANVGAPLTTEQAKDILANVAALPPHPDVVAAVKYFKASGIRLITLTNSSSGNTDKLLTKAGIRDQIDYLWPASDSGHWKPAPEPYHYAAKKLGLNIDEVALIAAHPWDIHGAVSAGMTGVYIKRQESLYQPSFKQPHFQGEDMLALAKVLMSL